MVVGRQPFMNILCLFAKFLRWSLQNMKSRGRNWIQIQLLPPYIYLILPIPNPIDLDPMDLVYRNEVLHEFPQ